MEDYLSFYGIMSASSKSDLAAFYFSKILRADFTSFLTFVQLPKETIYIHPSKEHAFYLLFMQRWLNNLS